MIVTLPFPSASLAGHNNGHWRSREREVATYRAEAFHLTRKAQREQRYKVPAEGDIGILIRFIPSNNLGDRVNYPIRIKAQLDGIAEALGVNDKRFLPFYAYHAAMKPGCVEVEFLSKQSTGRLTALMLADSADSATKKNDPSGALTPSGRDPISNVERTE